MKKDEEIKEVLPSILGIIKRGLEHPETEVSSWENLEMDINGGFSIAMFDYRGVFDE